MDSSISNIRIGYSKSSLLEEQANPNPVEQFKIWWDEAVKTGISEVNAMTLATTTSDGHPDARIVLLKSIENEGFIFFTNYNSKKGAQIAENPRAALVFFWKELERQVRVLGNIEKVSPEMSDEYFNSRPLDSQIGAITSPQSMVIKDRHWIDNQFESVKKSLTAGRIARPEYWGGYIVKPFSIEFWQGRPNRLHDRILYSLHPSGGWKIERLAP